MRKWKAACLAVLASATMVGSTGTSAEAAWAGVAWDGTIVEYANKLPSDWKGAVNDGIGWLDQYTGSDLRIVYGSCHANVRRCVIIKNARLTGGDKEKSTGWSEGNTITIDIWKIQNKSPWRGKFTYADKKYLIAHEAGHQRFEHHTTKCDNFMNPSFRCDGHTPYLWTNADQKARLAKY